MGGTWVHKKWFLALVNILCVSRFGGIVLEAFSVVNVTPEKLYKKVAW
jgi:hypothetical protein